MADGPAPLAGVRVLDAGSTLPGPYCTQLLADLGADVIAVERPGGGDPLRELMPGTFGLVNRGKRRVTLDLKNPADRVRLDRLLADADVLVVGFRPSVTCRLGLDAAAFAGHNPRGVHCSITGFGGTGGHRERPGHDLNYLGLAGALQGPHGVDDETGTAGEQAMLVADLASGALAALAVTAALRRRDATGAGCAIDLGMADVALSWSAVRRVDALLHPASPSRRTPGQGMFVTADGHPVTLGLIEDHFWARFVAEVPDATLRDRLADPRFATGDGRDRHHADATELLRAAVAAAPLAHWLAAGERADLPVHPALDFVTALRSAPFTDRGLLDVTTDGTPDQTTAGITAAFPALLDGAAHTAGPWPGPTTTGTGDIAWR